MVVCTAACVPSACGRTSSVIGRSGENPAPVVSDGMLLGLITRSRANDIMQGYWGERTVKDVMIPAAELPLVARDTPLSEVLPLIDPEALDPLPLLLVDAGRLEGLIVQREVQPLLEVEEAVALAAWRGRVMRDA